MPDTDDAEAGAPYAEHGHRHSLARQLRIAIDIALTVAPRSLLKALGSGRYQQSARRDLVERVVSAMSPFEIRWKGDDSADPASPAPWAKHHGVRRIDDGDN